MPRLQPRGSQSLQPAVEPEQQDSDSESVSSDDDSANGQNQGSRAAQRRSASNSDGEALEVDGSGGRAAAASHQHVTKTLVRFALSCEYARVPIRRSDISQKVLQPANANRVFKAVFDDAQLALRQTFGMEMVELPARDKVTITQRRQAQKSQSTQSAAAAKSNRQWILKTVLPEKYRDADIISPSKGPTVDAEACYVGLYSFIIAIIVLSGGSVNEARLEQLLRRANADETTPVDKKDRVIARMIKEGYIVRVRESGGGEEAVEYFLGPRGKTEVGDGGVANMVRKVFRKGEQGTTAEDDNELEKKIERSLRVSATASEQAQESQQLASGRSTRAEPKQRVRKKKNQADKSSDEDE